MVNCNVSPGLRLSYFPQFKGELNWGNSPVFPVRMAYERLLSEALGRSQAIDTLWLTHIVICWLTSLV